MTGQLIRNHRALLIGVLALGLLAAGAGQARTASDPGPLRQEVSLGPVRVTLEADRRTMPIDGQLRLTLVVEASGRIVITLPAIADKLGPFVVASQATPAASSPASGLERWRCTYVLEAEGAGALTVPPLTVAFKETTAGATQELATAPVAITVTSLLPADVDLTEYKDIAPPVELPRTAPSWLVWSSAAFLALGLAALALLVWRRRRRLAAAPLPAQPAHLLALAELERLGRQLPADRPGTEEFYVRLAHILRHYVAQRFALRAPTQTTEELLASVEEAGGPLAARRQLIGRVLAQCDLVKFARRQPTPATAPGSLRQAHAFVQLTADQ